jgi:hypothetical protein
MWKHRPDLDDLREKITETVAKHEREQGLLGGLSHTEIAAVLVRSAIAWCDFHGGEEDRKHAQKVCHRLVDEAYGVTPYVPAREIPSPVGKRITKGQKVGVTSNKLKKRRSQS